MAFSNEYLMEKEINLIKATELDSLLHIKRSKGKICEIICNVNRCTTDRENKRWLIRYRKGYGCEPKLGEEFFVLFYGAIHRDNAIDLCMKKEGTEDNPLILQKYEKELIYYWKVEEIEIPKQLRVEKQIILDMLEEIMNAYGICGNPEHKGPDFDGKIKTFVKG